MITGTVKFFNNDKGYGFIAPETGGGDAFLAPEGSFVEMAINFLRRSAIDATRH